MLSPDQITQIERIRLGHVASVTAGGFPAVSPKGTFVVLDAGHIAYGDIRSPGTRANLGHDPRVEVSFVDPFYRKGCRVRGSARILRAGTDEFAKLHPQWVTLWGDLATRITGLVVIAVDRVKPLSTPPYDDGVTEAEMLALYKTKYAEMYP